MAKAQTKRKKRESFRVGDRVEILNYKREIAWGDRTPQRYGFITNIDGAYILVRPRWQKDVIERYPNEIRHA